MGTLTRILAEQGPLDKDAIARLLQDGGVADTDAVLDGLLDETDCPARQLVDVRWV
jgi:hypothetical protein